MKIKLKSFVFVQPMGLILRATKQSKQSDDQSVPPNGQFMHQTILFYLPPWPFAIKWLLKKPYENEVALREQKPPLRCLIFVVLY